MSFADMLVCRKYNTIHRGNASYWLIFELGRTDTSQGQSGDSMAYEALEIES